jgi:hypothetical protein
MKRQLPDEWADVGPLSMTERGEGRPRMRTTTKLPPLFTFGVQLNVALALFNMIVYCVFGNWWNAAAVMVCALGAAMCLLIQVDKRAHIRSRSWSYAEDMMHSVDEIEGRSQPYDPLKDPFFRESWQLTEDKINEINQKLNRGPQILVDKTDYDRRYWDSRDLKELQNRYDHLWRKHESQGEMLRALEEANGHLKETISRITCSHVCSCCSDELDRVDTPSLGQRTLDGYEQLHYNKFNEQPYYSKRYKSRPDPWRKKY